MYSVFEVERWMNYRRQRQLCQNVCRFFLLKLTVMGQKDKRWNKTLLKNKPMEDVVHLKKTSWCSPKNQIDFLCLNELQKNRKFRMT